MKKYPAKRSANRIGPGRYKGGPPAIDWFDGDTAILRTMFKASTKEDILLALCPRTWISIQEQARKLGLQRNNPRGWSDADKAIVLARYEELGPVKTSLLLSHTRSALTMAQMARKLNVKYNRSKPKPAPEPAAPAKEYRPLLGPAKLQKAPAPVAKPEVIPGPAPLAKKSSYSADYIRTLPVNHPDRKAFNDAAVSGLVPMQKYDPRTESYYQVLVTPERRQQYLERNKKAA